MKSSRKNLSINIEYTDLNEALESMRKITSKIAGKKVRYDRQMENTAIYEWAIENVRQDDYTEQVIGGKICQVYQSKMNNQ